MMSVAARAYILTLFLAWGFRNQLVIYGAANLGELVVVLPGVIAVCFALLDRGPVIPRGIREPTTRQGAHVWLLILFMCAFSVAASRAYAAGTVTAKYAIGRSVFVMLQVVSLWLVFGMPPYRGRALLLVRDLYLAMALHITVSLGLWLLGVEGVPLGQVKKVEVPNVLGIVATRVDLPLNLNMFQLSAMAGVVLIMADCWRRWSSNTRLRLFHGGVLVVAALAILVAGNRAYVLYAVLGLGFLRLSKHRLQVLRWAPLVPALVPLILLTIDITPVARMVPGIDRFAFRGVEELVDLNKRTYIWGEVVNGLVEDPLHAVIGYGMFGHVTSGIARRYSNILSAEVWVEDMQHSAHNSYLQAMLDYGVIGVLLLAALLYAPTAGSWNGRSGVRLRAPPSVEEGRTQLVTEAVVVFLCLTCVTTTALAYTDHVGVTLLMFFNVLAVRFQYGREAAGRRSYGAKWRGVRPRGYPANARLMSSRRPIL